MDDSGFMKRLVYQAVLQKLKKKFGVVAIDYHFLQCAEGKEYRYQPCKAKFGSNGENGTCPDKRSNPDIWEPTNQDPEYFPETRLLGKMCCCKTGEPGKPDEIVGATPSESQP